VDAVFARDILARYLEKLGVPYLPYEDFYDVIRQFPRWEEASGD
jgi:2-hydroxy-3-keto-5-methylthiopentenyl-1-phosphate phosphatase